MSEQPTFEMYIHLYGKTVRMDDRFESIYIWSEELALKNRGRWIPQEVIGKKQTAVQWLEKELGRRQGIIDSEPDGLVKDSMYANLYVDLFNRALQMEREQMIQFGESVCQDGFEEWVEDEFNKTYGGQE